jgi:hypothetical protein
MCSSDGAPSLAHPVRVVCLLAYYYSPPPNILAWRECGATSPDAARAAYISIRLRRRWVGLRRGCAAALAVGRHLR